MCSDTEPERLAAAWHDAAGEAHAMDSSCWCCCMECDQENPHYEAGQAALKQWARAKRERAATSDGQPQEPRTPLRE